MLSSPNAFSDGLRLFFAPPPPPPVEDAKDDGDDIEAIPAGELEAEAAGILFAEILLLHRKWILSHAEKKK